MSAQHTPGPWTLTEKAVVASASTPIAHRVKWWSIGQLEIEENANARLIAAAPDLLEALRALHAACVKDGWPVYGAHPAAMNAALAAIAKATGSAS